MSLDPFYPYSSPAVPAKQQQGITISREWVSPEDELPPPHKDVLAKYVSGELFNGRVCYGMHKPFWCDNSLKDNPSDTIAKAEVIGWMPLSALQHTGEQT